MNVTCQQDRNPQDRDVYRADACALDGHIQLSDGHGGNMGVVEGTIRRILGRYAKEG
jgi:hypothetical protein